jgi:hypothetical protein
MLSQIDVQQLLISVSMVALPELGPPVLPREVQFRRLLHASQRLVESIDSKQPADGAPARAGPSFDPQSAKLKHVSSSKQN